MRKTCAVFCSIAVKCKILHSEVRMVCWNQGREALFATITCLCLCLCVCVSIHTLVHVDLYICRCIHLYIYMGVWVRVCLILLLLELVEALSWFGGFLIGDLLFSLSLTYLTVVNSWSNLLIKEKQNTSQNHGTTCASGFWSPQQKKILSCGFGSVQASTRAASLCKSWGVSSSYVTKTTEIKA